MSKLKRLKITFLGAAQTVTGSMFLLEAGERKLLIDCGLYQGRRKESNHRNRNLPRAATEADAVLLTHAHIDHSGNLPSLVKHGFKGEIHTTHATADLSQAMLMDSAHIHESDARWLNNKHADDPDWVPIEPLYTGDDARAALERFRSHPYDSTFEIFPGIKVTYIDAGHVLGSATVTVDVKMNGHSKRVVFSGDIGRRNLPILRDPTIPKHADFVVMESTYGNRTHAPAAEMQDQLLDVIESTRARGGKILIPSFALERTQEVVYALNQLMKSGRLKPIPVYMDSPLAINLTEVFRKHDECYDSQTEAFDSEHGDPFGFSMLRVARTVDQSKALNNLDEPSIIISASGMCEAGRVVHHLRNTIEDRKNTIVIVGYQAANTLGRRLVERKRKIRIFGVPRILDAEVRVLNAFSAHADRDELVWWARSCGRQVSRFFLVHGDPDQCEALADHLAEHNLKSEVPTRGQTIDLLKLKR